MKVNYDKKADVMYIRFSENAYYESNESEKDIIFDYDKKGKVIAIEILNASRNLPVKTPSFFTVQAELPFKKLVKPDRA